MPDRVLPASVIFAISKLVNLCMLDSCLIKFAREQLAPGSRSEPIEPTAKPQCYYVVNIALIDWRGLMRAVRCYLGIGASK